MEQLHIVQVVAENLTLLSLIIYKLNLKAKYNIGTMGEPRNTLFQRVNSNSPIERMIVQWTRMRSWKTPFVNGKGNGIKREKSLRNDEEQRYSISIKRQLDCSSLVDLQVDQVRFARGYQNSMCNVCVCVCASVVGYFLSLYAIN